MFVFKRRDPVAFILTTANFEIDKVRTQLENAGILESEKVWEAFQEFRVEKLAEANEQIIALMKDNAAEVQEIWEQSLAAISNTWQDPHFSVEYLPCQEEL